MSKYYVPNNFAKEAVKEIRRRECLSEESLEDSELEEIINRHFKQSICDNCETRILFDNNEVVSKELYLALDRILRELDFQEKFHGIVLSDRVEVIAAKQLIQKYKGLKQNLED